MADDLLAQIRVNGAVPRHIAVIMDGNGRWARQRSLPRPLGHRAGLNVASETVDNGFCARTGSLKLSAAQSRSARSRTTAIAISQNVL